jgi:transcriptional regulator with XRE-family HTH domain
MPRAPKEVYRESVRNVTGEQLRAARVMLGMSRVRLAELAKVNKTTIQNAEGGADIKVSTLIAIQEALELFGAEFCADGNVKRGAYVLRPPVGMEVKCDK